jgi:hypothetical protein
MICYPDVAASPDVSVSPAVDFRVAASSLLGRIPRMTSERRRKMAKNVICLWYDGTAEEAARFYA